MASRTLVGGLSLKGDWDLGEDNWKAEFDLNLLKLSVLVHGSAESLVAAEPGAPAEGVSLPQLETDIDAVIAELIDKGVSDDELERSKSRLVAELAPVLLRLAGQAGRRQGASPTRHMHDIRDYLDANRFRQVNSGDLEAVAGLDRFTIARQFRRHFGTSPHRYLLMRRLASARERISLGQPLADIAADTGFADQAHFSRHFKKAYGMTPGRWAQLTLRSV